MTHTICQKCWGYPCRCTYAASPYPQTDLFEAYRQSVGEVLANDHARRERDTMAGMAMMGMLAHPTRYRPREGAPENWHDALAQEAYQIADAMIRAKGADT